MSLETEQFIKEPPNHPISVDSNLPNIGTLLVGSRADSQPPLPIPVKKESEAEVRYTELEALVRSFLSNESPIRSATIKETYEKERGEEMKDTTLRVVIYKIRKKIGDISYESLVTTAQGYLVCEKGKEKEAHEKWGYYYPPKSSKENLKPKVVAKKNKTRTRKEVDKDEQERRRTAQIVGIIPLVLRVLPSEGYVSRADFHRLIDSRIKSTSRKTKDEIIGVIGDAFQKAGEMIVNVAETGEPILHRTSLENGIRMRERVEKNREKARQIGKTDYSTVPEVFSMGLSDVDLMSSDSEIVLKPSIPSLIQELI